MGKSARSLALKALQILLIARVLAAPVVLLADGGGETLGTVLVVRTCAWAAHQSRLTGRWDVVCRAAWPRAASTASNDLLLVDSSLPASGLPLGPPSSCDRYSRRSIGRLRC